MNQTAWRTVATVRLPEQFKLRQALGFESG